MNTTQNHIPISDIKEGLALLKDGGALVILKVSAVNFGLLSSEEQIAIIGSFAQMLNSLSFEIQITIISRRLDISSYIALLDKELALQTNPLLAQVMVQYRQFVESLIKDNEVLDKSFYIAIPVSRLELSVGVLKGEELFKKAKTVLFPRRDQVARQLNRVGLKVTQLDDKALLELFYSLYNPKDNLGNLKVATPREIVLNTPVQKASPVQSGTQNEPQKAPALPPLSTPLSRNHPFVVEELSDTV